MVATHAPPSGVTPNEPFALSSWYRTQGGTVGEREVNGLLQPRRGARPNDGERALMPRHAPYAPELTGLPTLSDRGRRQGPSFRSARAVMLAALLLSFSSVDAMAVAQERTVAIPDQVSCPDCRITFTRFATLGDSVGFGMVGENGWVWRSPSGEFFVTSTEAQPGAALVFDRDGLYMRRVGRPGQGPGEFVSPRVFYSRGDSLRVFDRGRPRVTLIHPGGVETKSLPFAPHQAIWLGEGLHLYSTVPRTPALIGRPFHVFDETRGAILRSFGGNPDGRYDPGRDYYNVRFSIAPSEGGEFWAAPLNRYEIERWTSQGERVIRIIREAPWFVPWTELGGMPREVRPVPNFVGVREDAAGLLWAFHRIADREWAPQPPAEVRGNHARTSMLQHETLYDTVIEVIDPRAGVVLARAVRPEHILSIAGTNVFYTYEEIGPGHPRYVLWRVALER